MWAGVSSMFSAWHHPNGGGFTSQDAREDGLRFRSKLVLSKGVLCIAPSTENSALDGSRVGAGEARSGTQSRPGHALCWSHIPSQSFGLLLTCCPQECQQGLPLPHSDVVRSISQLWPPEQHISPGGSSLHPSGVLPHRARGAKVGLIMGQGTWLGGHGKLARVLGNLSLLTQPCLENKETCMWTSQVESKFLIVPPSPASPVGPQASNRTHPPGMGPKVWHIQYVVGTTYSPGSISRPV